MPDPDYVRRLRRAKERIEFLHERVERWRKAQGNPFFVEFDSARGEHVFRNRELGTPPDRFGLDIGECLFYLRSGLDYIAHRLGDTHSGPIAKANVKELRKVEFPIFGERTPSPGELEKRIIRAHPNAIQIIKDMQPYLRGDYTVEPLWVLQELNNVDKHRMITPIAMARRIKDIREINARTLRARFAPGGPIVDRGEVYRTRYEPIDPNLPSHIEGGVFCGCRLR